MSMRDKIAKAILGGKVGGPTPSGIHVYHSSPHDFDKFDLAKIGTGEGAQVYGHGIYAAENPAVSGQGGQYWNQFLHRMPENEMEAATLLRSSNFDRTATAAETQKRLDELRAYANKRVPELHGRPDLQDQYGERIRRLQDRLELLNSGAPVGPRTYEVNFRAKPEELLDWDKPLSKQPMSLQEWARKQPARITGNDMLRGQLSEPTGESIYRRLGYASEATKRLSDEAGIPGIRYLDEGSRITNQDARNMVAMHGGSREAALAEAQSNAGPRGPGPYWQKIIEQLQPATHNYVAFDPSKLDIMAKYGVVGGVPLGAATMSGAFDPATYGERQ